MRRGKGIYFFQLAVVGLQSFKQVLDEKIEISVIALEIIDPLQNFIVGDIGSEVEQNLNANYFRLAKC